jgi:hypothetical protein
MDLKKEELKIIEWYNRVADPILRNALFENHKDHIKSSNSWTREELEEVKVDSLQDAISHGLCFTNAIYSPKSVRYLCASSDTRYSNWLSVYRKACKNKIPLLTNLNTLSLWI